MPLQQKGANKAVQFTGNTASKATFSVTDAVDGASKFTFEAWVYIDQWKETSYIFSKSAGVTNRIDIKLGTASNRRLY